MDHHDHVNLLRPGQPGPGGTWADFGAGSGAFTLALRELVGPDAKIHAVDQDKTRLKELGESFHARFNSTSNLTLVPGDFSGPLDLPSLDGVVMANSLHFFKDRSRVLKHAGSFMKHNGRLLLVEYNVDSGNPWVPHPISFESFRTLAMGAGFSEPEFLAKKASRFLREIYSAAASWRG